MQTWQNFVFALLKLVLNFFPGITKLLLMSKVSPSPNIKILFLRLSEIDYELLSTPEISNKTNTKIPLTFPIKCYFIARMNPPFFIATFYDISCSTKQLLNVKFLR